MLGNAGWAHYPGPSTAPRSMVSSERLPGEATVARSATTDIGAGSWRPPGPPCSVSPVDPPSLVNHPSCPYQA